MAWTVSKVTEATLGDKRMQIWSLSADSATYELSTGLKNVVGHSVGINTCTSGGFHIKPNVLSAGAASYGTVSITGCTSADIFFLTVYGN